METFRLSYTILSKVQQGYIDEAIAMYEGKQLPPTPQMEYGKLAHEYFERYIKKHKAIPDIIGGGELGSPQIEVKLVKRFKLSDKYIIELVGVIDCFDKATGTMYEWKTGRTPANAYLGYYQHAIYKLLMNDAKRCEYRRYSQYDDSYEVAWVWLTDKVRAEAVNYLQTYASMFIESYNFARAHRDDGSVIRDLVINDE